MALYPLIFQHVSPKNKHILLHNCNTIIIAKNIIILFFLMEPRLYNIAKVWKSLDLLLNHYNPLNYIPIFLFLSFSWFISLGRTLYWVTLLISFDPITLSNDEVLNFFMCLYFWKSGLCFCVLHVVKELCVIYNQKKRFH